MISQITKQKFLVCLTTHSCYLPKLFFYLERRLCNNKLVSLTSQENTSQKVENCAQTKYEYVYKNEYYKNHLRMFFKKQ